MKKALLTFITAMMAFPLFAQYTGPGYYRVQNQGPAKRYISIANNGVEERYNSKSKVLNLITTSAYGFEIPVSALETVKKKDGNPSTILYISGSTAEGLNIKGQGMDTKSLTQGYQLLERNGYLYTKINESGVSTEAFLVEFNDDDKYDDSNCSVIGQSKLKDFEGYTNWTFEKIDNETHYLGIDPSKGIQIGDKYYTTFYADYAIELPAGMKAYYVDAYKFDKVAEPVAELKEITDGKIPAETPVIIECSSNSIANNKVKILTDQVNKITDTNKLVGRYFCYIEYTTYKKTYELPNPDLKNALEFDTKTMRVLGQTEDGKLGFVDNNDNALKVNGSATGTHKYIPANSAYLKINESEASAKKIKLLSPEEYQVALSISKVTAEESSKSGIYTLTGVKVKEDNNTDGLPNGIYIINGKKQVIR